MTQVKWLCIIPHHTTPHHTTPHHTTPHHTTLLPEYRIAYINGTDSSLANLKYCFYTRDKELSDRFVIDNENPDYVIANLPCLCDSDECLRLRNYMRGRNDRIFIFISLECIEPDMNIFDYAFTWNAYMICSDRIAHHLPAVFRRSDAIIFENDITPEEARAKLDSNLGFCNFMYSHRADARDQFFHLLSQYKRVDSLGPYLHNTDTKSTRDCPDWPKLSIIAKSNYKFSIAMENASCRGYTTEKIITSLRAHTVPIYWGDPSVAEMINPKAFVNCHDYSSFDEVIERVKEIDSDNELWLDIITQPWQTEEQKRMTLRAADENDKFIRNIFTQDIKKARRRTEGIIADKYKAGFTGAAGELHPLRAKAFRMTKTLARKILSEETRYLLKNFVHKN